MANTTRNIKESVRDVKRWEDYDTILCPDGQVIDMQKLLEDQERAKVALAHLEPFLGSMINRIRFVYTFHVQTQATDGYNIFVNPQFTANMDFEGKIFVLAHELWHCILNHLRRGRQKGHDPHKSNIAADYEVNATISLLDFVKDSVQKKLGSLLDHKYDNMAYEQIYDSNPPDPTQGNQNNSKQSGQAAKNQQGQGQGQSGQGGQSGSSDSDIDKMSGQEAAQDAQQSAQRAQSAANQSKKNGTGDSSKAQKAADKAQKAAQDAQSAANQGDEKGARQKAKEARDAANEAESAAGNQSGQSGQGRGNGKQGVVRPEDCAGQFGNNQPNTPGTFTDRKEGKELAEAEGYEDNQGGDDALSKEWKEQSIKNSSKLRGNSAGAIKSKIEAVWNTTTDWKKALRDIIGRSLNVDDKRSAYANKNVLTSQSRIARTDKDRYDVVDYMVGFIDSSGSMSDRQLQIVLGEIYNIALKKKPIKFVVVQCDTKIQEIKEYMRPEQIRKDFKTATVKGRGGTELKPCWDLLLKDKKYNKRPAELAIVFTDGYLTQYKRNPRTMSNLVWVILDNPGFKLEYPDPKTKVIYLKTEDID